MGTHRGIGTEDVRQAPVCGWTPRCTDPAEHTVRSHTRPGLVLTFHVCDLHRRIAVSQGYHLMEKSTSEEQQ
jgi:hypothetical protein